MKASSAPVRKTNVWKAINALALDEILQRVIAGVVMKSFTFCLILITAVSISACKKAQSNAPASDAGATQQSETVSTFRYYKGGYFPPPNQPNWSNDMTITFTSNGFSIVGKHSDPLCTRRGTFSEPQAAALFNYVAHLLLAQKTINDPMGVDGGVEYIEITTVDGRVRKYNLMSLEIQPGEYYATNPSELHSYLQNLEASLTTSCQ